MARQPHTLAAVDVGGTFTDLAVWDGEQRTVTILKLLTTPEDPTQAIVQGLSSVGQRSEAVIHATTLITNALIERKGALTGLITTEGFRDVLEIGKELRYDSFNLSMTLPQPLVPRKLRRTVRERIGFDANVVQELDEDALATTATQLVDAGVESIAIALFNSYRNPAHERRAAELLRDIYPQIAISTSADIAPEIREFERFSTVVANAYVQPLASSYLLKLSRVIGVPLFIVLSDGGITTSLWGASHPISLVESGPAAGAMAAAHTASAADWPEVMAFDMGGTTAKLSLIHAGEPQRTHEMEVARVDRFKRGSGIPVRVPTVELIEIGAGGGSIARADALGLLKVGPTSAGASPGPACYARGGIDPTVTDADLHLGYISAQSFLGGRMKLEIDRANRALDGLAESVGLSRTATAAGIVDIVNNNMAIAARVHVAEHGRDPRSYRMIAFGGAGPVHAYGLAKLLHIDQIVFPRGAGVGSALGMLVAPRTAEFTRSLIFRLDDPDWEAADSAIAELEAKTRGLLEEAGAAATDILLEISVDARYVGQGFEITVPVAPEVIRGHSSQGLHAAFESAYRQRFDRTLESAPAEVISWRVRGWSSPAVDTIRLPGSGGHGRAQKGERQAYFGEAGGFINTPVYDRAELAPNALIDGPALIEEPESTAVIGPSSFAKVDDLGNLALTIRRQPRGTEQ